MKVGKSIAHKYLTYFMVMLIVSEAPTSVEPRGFSYN